MAKGKAMIKVFRCPCGKNEYRRLYNQIKESGWQVLGVKKHLLCEDWLIRAVKKDYFFAQTYENQVRIAKGERRSNY
jgi:hypothetical protein